MWDFFGKIFGLLKSPGGLAMVTSGLKIFFFLEFKKQGICHNRRTIRLIFGLDFVRGWRRRKERALSRLFVSFDAGRAFFGFRWAKLGFLAALRAAVLSLRLAVVTGPYYY